MCNKFQQVICIGTDSNKIGPSEQLFSMTFAQMVSMCNMTRPLQMLHGKYKRQPFTNILEALYLYICQYHKVGTKVWPCLYM